MEMANLTQRSIDAAIKSDRSNRQTLRDHEVRGLALVVNSSSTSWVFTYKPRGANPETGKRWATQTVRFGNLQSHSLKEARRDAAKLKSQLMSGMDPADEARKRREEVEAARLSGTACSELAQMYASYLDGRQALVPRYRHGQAAQVSMAIDEMNVTDLPVSEITNERLRAYLQQLGQRPGIARQREGALSRFLSWCIHQGHLEADPRVRISRAEKPAAPRARERWLTLAELGAVWRAAEDLGEPVLGNIVRFLIAVPARRGEVAGAEWSQVGLETGVWHVPSHLSKTNEPHRQSLNRYAREILQIQKLESANHNLVFPSPRAGKAITGWSTMKRKIDAVSGVADWRWHDLRRTFASHCAERGVSETVADLILSHKQSATRPGVMAVYQRSRRWEERVAAMEVWAGVIEEAIRAASGENRAPLSVEA